MTIIRDALKEVEGVLALLRKTIGEAECFMLSFHGLPLDPSLTAEGLRKTEKDEAKSAAHRAMSALLADEIERRIEAEGGPQQWPPWFD